MPMPAVDVRPARKGPLRLDPIPEILRPLIRAYLLGYASAVAPRLLTLVLQHVAKRKKKLANQLAPDLDDSSFVSSAAHIEPLKSILEKTARGLSEAGRLRLARWLSTFLAAWFGLRLLHSYEGRAYTETVPPKEGSAQNTETQTVKFAGRTMDLTLFAVTRALDVLVGDLWARHKARRLASNRWSKAERFLSKFVDPLVFAASSGLVMWAWFYHPSRLPRSYNKWITSAASVDLRLIEALRRCHSGEFQYGKETGQAHLLQGMCVDYEWPLAWGDPAVVVPIPCQMVHMSSGPSCEYHAASRFFRAWKWSMATYLPLTLALALRNPSRKALRRAIISSCRSSSFLATFITLFYYGVCLSRTRVGPRLPGGTAIERHQIMDSGICVGTGCLLCGWSIMIETESRRKDIALFVAPRALATILPRRYSLDKEWRERLVFAASTAVVFTCVAENPDRVRGVFGKLLKMVLSK
ncbi:related to integral membrane protein [Fusarium fujikuroi]|uniref:Related to integral membrane protein n=2 Tax=Fusarium fujikuroi TaxID=5127 RepID=S0DXW2_GIBF5|nr:related to integral membrane protein [Fusarium fujikuroi IMI 58289]QGI80612.1 hypothetical protein CEK25_007341 [Fusarium fujikuroi]QGI94216.1 hypothetical protein CEK26_007285 [Fusarium fujikuroi]CCT67295.1 related to integral membrane protein [Fusarium fujikuroi IMI 58289]SCN90742.1 related to integral membrane protein [Fusarium fujikuroi]SCN96803.1 related to integral membrane protein [Fusarium fujikuroi]